MQQADIIFTEEVIINKIYTIRGHKVMLDRDLANLYLVDTKRLNEQVKRNLKRFPDDFMFQLTNAEFEILKSQFATSSWGGTRKLPFAFTEHGVLMLSSILNSNRAIEVNIQIMRIFSKIRRVLADTSELRILIDEIRRKTENNSKNIEVVFKYLDELIEKQETKTTRNKIGFNANNV
jgi:hypothetical protein